MTHDLDDVVRDAMRRHADDAPHILDLDRVVARSRTITRRRRAVAAVGAVGAGMLLVGAVAGVGALTGRGTHPGPLDQSPTATATLPTPSSTVPLPSPTGTTAPSPTSTPAPAARSWTVTSVDLPADPATPEPPQTGLVLTVGLRTTTIDHTNAALWIAGWTGPGRRSIVYGWSQDADFDQELRIATFDDSGTLVDGPRDLMLPGGGRLSGRAFVTADGGLAVASYDTTTYAVSTLYRFSNGLGDVTAIDLPAGNEVIAATADAVVLQNLIRTTVEQDSERHVTLLSGGHQRRITLPACRSDYLATSSADETTAALFCVDQDVVRLLPLAATASGDLQAPVRVTQTVPGDGSISWAGVDQQGDVVATRTPGSKHADWTGATTWRLAAGSTSWTSAAPVVSEEYVGDVTVTATWDTSGDSPLVRLTTRTDPVVELGTATEADYAVRLQPAS
jgi:hypothetical protein